MIFFWFAVAVIFLIFELLTLTFGFIFITVGAVVITLLLGAELIAATDYLYQILIMLFFGIISFLFFYRSYKKSKNNTESKFKEDMTGVVIDADLVKGVEGKIRWSGTICNALIEPSSKVDSIPVGTNVVISEFKGNVAIVKEIK